MILTMIDAENRMQVLKYDGEKLEELATLKMVTVDRIEMAQIAATLALMAGEGSSQPVKAKSIAGKATAKPKPKPEALPAPKKLPAAVAVAGLEAQKKKAPAKKKTYQRLVNANYTPDLLSGTGKVMLVLETFGHPMSASEIDDEMPTMKKSVVYATLQALVNMGVLDRTSQKGENDTRKVSYYGLSQHGHDSIARARGEAVSA